MSLVTSTELFKKAYDGGYAIGAFNVNNMEIVQESQRLLLSLSHLLFFRLLPAQKVMLTTTTSFILLRLLLSFIRRSRLFFTLITVQILLHASLA